MKSDFRLGEINLSLPKRTTIKKGWGGFDQTGIGEVFVYHTEQENEMSKMNVETVKLLYIKKDKQLSFHYHSEKKEIFYMITGRIELLAAPKYTGIGQKFFLQEGDTVLIEPGLIHSMKGLEEKNILLEVSTLDKLEDSIRLIKGD